MKNQILIIISGLPCTGKTNLAQKIADKFQFPLISKDYIKESLFDSLGHSDREFSKKIGAASYKLLYGLVEELLSRNVSAITETNFKAKFDNEIFKKIIQKYNVKPFQIVCKTNGEVLFKRFQSRSESIERHPGHVDNQNYEEFGKMLKSGEYTPLDIGGKLLEVDTTDFSIIDYNSIFDKIDKLLNE